MDLHKDLNIVYNNNNYSLQKLGISNFGSGGVCAVILNRSVDYLIALKMCLETNTCFMPLNPALTKRNNEIIKSVKPRVIWGNDIKIYNTKETVTHPYLIFTSGSTGKPKGVYGNMKGGYNVINEQIRLYKHSSNTRMLWMLNPAFDASLSDIFTTWQSEGTILIASDINKIKAFKQFISDNKPTHADIPPSMLHIMKCYDLCVISGGESIYNHTKYSNLWNAYGPTETSICSHSCKVVDWDKSYLGSKMPGVIEKVVDNELYIGGDNVSPGYFNNEYPEKFQNGFFRTGDIVGENSRGLYYIGRRDRQVKVNGVLICLEEIERCYGNDCKATCENGKISLYVNKLLKLNQPLYELPVKVSKIIKTDIKRNVNHKII